MRERFCAPLLSLLAALWCALIISPPFLAEAGLDTGAALTRLFFAPICHQIPERSLHILGTPLPVCARCAGIYGGALLAFVLATFGVRAKLVARSAGAALTAAAVPSLVGWILSGAGFIPDAAIMRAVAGGILGAAVGACLLPAIEALCAELASPRGNTPTFMNGSAGPSPSSPTGG